ncbi:hypothetical protein GBA52_027192 [Prunus armeniaca]|nr:hypothetical protein GBA52_027192 [Prunus armeniaca]
MRGTLVRIASGLIQGNIQLLTDAAAAGSSSSVMPTGANIKKALGAMVDQKLSQTTSKPLAKGVTFTILSDSCHSGGLIDKEKEQIGPSHVTEISNTSPSVSSKPKGIPFESILHHLASLTSINTSDIATHLLELFAADANLKFRLPPLELLNMLGHRT